ncbi:MAG: putative NADH-flavin reductase [Paraglaciecola sp.]|jgi:putative NADH-flavin reductase
MKITLIGATGMAGSGILEELLQRGHTVRALVRDLGRLKPRLNLEVFLGDAYDSSSVSEAAKGSDIVISAFGPGWTSPDLYDLFVRGSLAIERGVEASGIKRLFVIGGAGSLYVSPGVQYVDTPEFPKCVPPIVIPGVKGCRDTFSELLKNTVLDWTYLSPPPKFEAGERTGSYRVGGDEMLMDGDVPGDISVADLAIAVVDEIESPKHIRKRFTVAKECAYA